MADESRAKEIEQAFAAANSAVKQNQDWSDRVRQNWNRNSPVHDARPPAQPSKLFA